MSSVVDHLKTNATGDSIAYFYCLRADGMRRDPAHILRSFVRQLSLSSDLQAIHDALLATYKRMEETGFASGDLTYEYAEEILFAILKGGQRTILLLDALDESYEQSRRKLITTFGKLIKEVPKIKIMISSRRDWDIEHELQKEANLGIGATENGDDIRMFVAAEIEADRLSRQTPISNDLIAKIIQTLNEKSQGMYDLIPHRLSYNTTYSHTGFSGRLFN